MLKYEDLLQTVQKRISEGEEPDLAMVDTLEGLFCDEIFQLAADRADIAENERLCDWDGWGGPSDIILLRFRARLGIDLGIE